MIDKRLIEHLIDEALQARKNAYAPYSNYYVGAAVLTADDIIYTGCNIENASYGATNCAERTAIFKAVSDGHLRIKAIAIAGGPKDSEPTEYAFPCGICRQVIREFSDTNNINIIVANSKSDYKIFTLEELLPSSFGPDNLTNN